MDITYIINKREYWGKSSELNARCLILPWQHFKMILPRFPGFSLCTDNCVALWFLQCKLQPIHTNLLNSAGSGKKKEKNHNCSPAGYSTAEVGGLDPIQAVQTLNISLVP